MSKFLCRIGLHNMEWKEVFERNMVHFSYGLRITDSEFVARFQRGVCRCGYVKERQLD
jgi:hypothetical protein